MKYSKCICGLLAGLVLTLSVGCSEDKQPSQDELFFGLASTPTAEATENKTVYNRLNSTYTAQLVASDSYGELFPFVGGFNTYKSTAEGSQKTLSNPVYGLCDKNGTVIVDAVYDAVKKHLTDEGGYVYELVKGSDGSDPKTGERWIAAVDGSWVVEIPSNCVFRSVGAERVVFERTRTVRKVTYIYLDFYDFSGKKRFTFDSKLAEDANTSYTVGAFAEGVAPVNVTVKTPNEKKDGEEQTYTESKYAYYIDNNGKTVYDKFSYCESFSKGYAVAATEEGLYGVIDPKGEWFIEPKYRIINYNTAKGLFACGDDGLFDILNTEKNKVKTVLCQRGNVEILDCDRLIYKKTNADTERSEYFYADTDAPFTCVENAMFPDSDVAIGGLFVSTYLGTGTVFDENGDNLASIGDFGELADRFGNTAVVVNSTDKKVCFISVSAKRRTEWLNLHYTRQSAGDRYLVMRATGDAVTYCLYDTLTESFLYENSDYIEISFVSGTELISVVGNGRTTVYDSGFNPVISTVS